MEDNVNVWGLFDLEEPATEPEEGQEPEGEQEQEIADPADEGEQDQEVADPECDVDDGSDHGQESRPDKTPLTKEERAANAARRRQQEVSDAVNAALEKERAENKARWDKFFAQAQMKNQHENGAVIDSLEKAEQWAEQDRLARLQKNLKQGNLTAEDLQTAMEHSPAFKELKQKQEASEQAAARQMHQQFSQNVEMELAQIQKINPEIKSLADIIRMPTGKEFGRYVSEHGLNYLDAYMLANHDQLVEQARTVATAGAKVASAGKEHMTRTTTRGTAMVEVPKEIKEGYRMFDPSMTDADIEKEYRKFLGRKQP